MTRPLDRTCQLEAIGEVDEASGEFWVENPFMIPGTGNNLSAYERNKMFLNVSGQDFMDASFASPVDLDSDSRAAITADFDGDGMTDLLVASVGGGPLRLFRNRFPRSFAHVKLDLVGTESNADALGARVIIETDAGQVIRDRFRPNGCLGQGPGDLLIGIGKATTVKRLSVRWPNGATQEWLDLPVNATLTLTEGQDAAEVREGVGLRSSDPTAETL